MPDAKKSMTVKQAIEFLSSIPDKEVVIMLDCPHCGRGAQLASMVEAVILKSEELE